MHNKRGPEKAKNFSQSIKRLFKELKPFKILIIISISLSIISSILSIVTPNKLSDLTDNISSGLTINTKNIELIKQQITTQLTNYDYEELIKNNPEKENEINEFISTKNTNSLSNETLLLILNDITIDNQIINKKDLVYTINKLQTIDTNNKTQLYQVLNELPDSVKKVINPKIDLTKIKNITLFLLILYIISAIFHLTEALLMTVVSNNFAKKMRTNITSKINKLPLKFFDKNQTGDTLSRITNDVDTISQGMDDSLSTLVSSITLFLGTTIMMFVTNATMAITAIVSSLIGFFSMSLVLKNSQKYFIARQQELGKLNSHIEEIYSGLLIVKAYNGKKESDKKFDALNKNVYEANRKSQFLSGIMMPMMGFVGNLGYVAVCIAGAILTTKGIITFGVIVAFMTYVRLFTNPLSQIGQAVTSLQSTAAASERVFEFMDEEEMSSQKEMKEKLLKEDVIGNIEFKNVSFKYDGNEKNTINNFNAKALKGQKIAIVGPTGAGKTTMVNLLMKFYDISDGDILIDNHSIHNLTRENIHNLFTMVLQDTWLFDGTIKENIKFNNKNVSDEKIKEICKTIGLDHFIKSLPKGYDSIISDNDIISSGQKQLLTIARGMIEDTPFIILDEATSNVDTRTEELVSSAMDKLTEGKTSFIIAHRLSTIKNADLILVMNNGDIIETGNHEELMKKNGFYAELYNSQFEL